ncbi:ABC transporter permease [Treponema pectinovorum]|uniref:ABC transporter permease n=1 Tax=Treponema pectinovorum TaxID=164 RepID=UPI0011C6FB07|nr:ABC transporter permease subunit [Treponema pectinovorum]
MADTNLKVQLKLNKVKTFFNKPQNVILLLCGIVLSITTIAPILYLLQDTIAVHAGTVDSLKTGLKEGQITLYNWKDLIAGNLAKANLWKPMLNTILLSVFTCFIAIVYGGFFAYLITRTNMKLKKYLSAIFIFPYIMPQWTLAMVWRNAFNSNAVTGGSDGLLASLFNLHMPGWWCQGLFPSALVLGLHYAAFAYILIGGIFRNMDANLEEAATILNTPKWKTMLNVTIPLVKPAVLSTILLVFGSAMGSYPVPHYLNLETLSTKYVGLSSARAGQASVIAVMMMIFGIAILLLNQRSTSGRQSFTTVTGKSGQITKSNLGSFGKYFIALIFVVLTLFTSIYPIISFAIETFLPNPGDYSFLKTGDMSMLTTKWWTTSDTLGEYGLFGQLGMLYNVQIKKSFFGQLFVAVCCSLCAGTIGTFVGYAVSKNRRSKGASYVNSVAFLPYLMPSLSVGVAYLIFGKALSIGGTFLILILVGTVKYIPFASRSSLNSMLQLSGEIEESAIIHNIPWFKRMFGIIIPIQKNSILSGFLLPFMTCLRELTLFMLLCDQFKIMTTAMDYFDEMGLYAFSSGMNLILIITILFFNALVNKLTGASIDKGVGGN